MAKVTRNALLLAKIQPTPGTDPVPTASANAILASNLDVNPITTNFEDRNNIKPYMGNMGQIGISFYASLSFDVELQSSGAAGTAPKFGPLLRACAMGETISAGTSVVYAPVSTGHELVTFYYYLDGILCKMTDARGSVRLDVSAGKIPKMSFTFTGLYSVPTDQGVPTGSDYSGFKDPLGINKVNTPTFTLHGTAFKAESLVLDLANQVEYRNLIGAESVIITDRKPNGSTSIELEPVATKDWYTAVRLGTLGAIQLIHGSVAGNIVQIDAPKVQPTSPTYSDSQGIAMLNLNLALQPNAGNDELVLTFK